MSDDLLQSLNAQSDGAGFHRADLHIHSYGPGGSYDVTDTAMTPEGIIDTAVREQLGIIAITDHNAIGNVDAAFSYSLGKSICLVPAVEISTSQGHLLCYFPDIPALQQFVGKLTISADRRSCSETLAQTLELADQFGGFGILAHVDLEGGIEAAMPKFNPFKEEVYCSKALLGIEVASKENASWYSPDDPNPQRKGLFDLRRKKLCFDEAYRLARVMSSDAHALSALGKNAAGNRKLTRFKMENLSFAALRVAVEDSTARVRIEEAIPADVPRFIGMRISGGFLTNQVVRFNKNLNCIIGGRGTGKSTLIESLRVGAGTDINREDFVDSDAWPDKIELIYRDQSGREQTFVREKFGETVNQTDPEQGVTRVTIESYGQGDTAEAIQHSDKDPSVLLRFLDEFLVIDQCVAEDEQLRQALLDNQTAVERLSLDVKGMPDVAKAKRNADEQVRVLKEKEAGKLVVLEEKLANGKAFRQQLIGDLAEIVESAREALSDTVTLESLASRDGSDLPVGREQFEDVRQLLQAFAKKLAKHSTDIQSECEEIVVQIQEKLAAWRSAEAKVQQELDAVRKDLEGKGVRLDVGFIKKATKDAAEFAAKLQELQRRKIFLGKVSAERTELVTKRKDNRREIFNERSKLAITLERNLRATIVDYSISVRFGEGRYSPELEEIIKTAMEWRTSRVPRAVLITRAMSPPELAEAVRRRQLKTITAISSGGEPVFTETEASQIVEKLSEPRVMFAIERCAYEDLPEIRVSRIVDSPSGEKKNVTKSFAKLSLGQQQSILLSIMLFSKNECPLIIDQPEDNLDSEFIYKTFVRVLRSIKERRQVIVVTHNANIAVLGDAELIIPLKATSDQATIQNRGSIDTPETRSLACAILEGSEEAFRRRMAIYGFR